MQPLPNVTDWGHYIDDYERRILDSVMPPPFSDATLNHHFIQVRGLSAFWRTDGFRGYARRAAELASGAHAYHTWFVFLLTGCPNRVDIYYALDQPETITNFLRSTYPGVDCRSVHPAAVKSIIAPRFAYSGRLTGVPHGAEDNDGETVDNRDETGHLERVVRGMRYATWAYMVTAYAHATSYDNVTKERRDALDVLASAASSIRQQVQQSVQHNDTRRADQSTGQSVVLGGEHVDWHAQYLTQVLEHQMKRLDEALAVGQWRVGVQFGATTPESAEQLGTLLSSVFSGVESRPERIRALLSTSPAPTPGIDFYTNLNSRELGVLTRLPREEAPGYGVSDFAPFDVDVPPRVTGTGTTVEIGEVLRDGALAGVQYDVLMDDLTKHALIAGVTGAGKTTTVRRILRAVAKHGATFLVIEPAKTEYRGLLPLPGTPAASGTLPDLHIFTLGNERVAPFRFNPFEFEITPLPVSGGIATPATGNGRTGPSTGTSSPLLLSHIDLLKATFNAAFILYAPMPYVLEIALHEVYEDKGWNLSTGENMRVAADDPAQHLEYPTFPTLADLEKKIESVTHRLGYDREIEQDVIAGLKGRISSLRIGSKGMMLDVPRGVSMAQLLTHPTILELENIGNDSEKTFLMGLILGRLYEVRRLQAAVGQVPRGLQHVLVIEEAHRLLQRTATEVEVESSNARAQAIETFVNILSEIRRYGQAVMVAEQIPSKLAPDVVKNTSLKVLHRLLAEDDRSALAATMNMTELQSRQLTTLRAGQAAVSAEGDDHPYLIQVPPDTAQHSTRDRTDDDVKDAVRRTGSIDLSRYLPLSRAELSEIGLDTPFFHAPDSAVHGRAVRFIDRATTSVEWTVLVLRAAYLPEAVGEHLDMFRGRFDTTPGRLSASGGRDRERDAFRLALSLGAVATLYDRMNEYGWTYHDVQSLKLWLLRGLLTFTDGVVPVTSARACLSPFVSLYKRLLARYPRRGPYVGCVHCPAQCHYHADTVRLVAVQDKDRINEIVGDVSISWSDRFDFIQDYIEPWLCNDHESSVAAADLAPTLHGLTYCATLVAIDSVRPAVEKLSVSRQLGHVLAQKGARS